MRVCSVIEWEGGHTSWLTLSTVASNSCIRPESGVMPINYGNYVKNTENSTHLAEVFFVPTSSRHVSHQK